MFRFTHTSDWQMGMMAVGLGLAAEKVRAARIAALKNILALANDRKVDAILVAGDQFEHNQVASTVVEQVVGILNDQTRIPIYLIPGNHDPYSRDSIYRKSIWQQLRPHIHVMTEPKAVTLRDGVVLYPCPLARKHGMEDPTAWIPAREGPDLRIALAHGTMRIRADVGDDDFPIPLDAAEKHGLDYLALGHWHSMLADASGRCSYSGTHETSRFGERESGNTLVVTLTTRTEKPQVESVRTGILTWLDQQLDLDRVPLSDAMRRFREWEHPDCCLLRLGLEGAVTAQTAAEVEELSTLLTQRFLFAGCNASKLRTGSVADLAEGLGSPYIAQAAQQLSAIADGSINDGETSPAVAKRALQLLQKAVWQAHQP